MISCLGTSIVATRRSIFTILSMIGISSTMPGPLAPCGLPSRKITRARIRADPDRLRQDDDHQDDDKHSKDADAGFNGQVDECIHNLGLVLGLLSKSVRQCP